MVPNFYRKMPLTPYRELFSKFH